MVRPENLSVAHLGMAPAEDPDSDFEFRKRLRLYFSILLQAMGWHEIVELLALVVWRAEACPGEEYYLVSSSRTSRHLAKTKLHLNLVDFWGEDK